MNSPTDVIKQAGKTAILKGQYNIRKTLILAFLAGAYISFGGLLSVIVAGGSPGIMANNPGITKLLFGAAFPLGLILVVVVGAELFTGNTAYFIPNVLNKTQKLKHMLRNWGLVYFGNFIGSIFVAYVIVYMTHIVHQEPYSDFVNSIAVGKTSHTFLVTFIKGIGANWLVCLALWQGMAAKDVTGKIFALWWPVMAFVTMGFEHSVANMFFIPLAIFEGADITWGTFVTANLIPATLGNIVGGALFVGTSYWSLFGKKK